MGRALAAASKPPGTSGGVNACGSVVVMAVDHFVGEVNGRSADL